MRKLLGLGAVVALATAFAFASAAYAAPGGVPGKPGGKKHAAFNAFVADPVPCADSVALVPTGSIAVGLDEPQCYTYDMVIQDAEAGTVHRDELTANWDLDGASEAAVDDASGIGGDSDLEDGLNDGITDGLDEADQEDGVDDGVCHDPGDGFTTVVACGDYIGLGGSDSFACADGACDGTVTDGSCPDGTCDGVDLVGGCSDAVCDGLSVTETDLTCTVFASQPDSAIKANAGNVPAKQPEFIIVTIDSVSDATNECSVQVSARTVLNPGGSDPSGGGDPDLFDDCDGADVCVFEPRKCEPLREFTRDPTDILAGIITDDDGVPFVNYETLNLGIKSFADDRTIIVGGGGFVTTKLSVELEPTGCDTDGDGILDVNEATDCALDPDSACGT